MMNKTNNDELRGSDKNLPRYRLHVNEKTGEGFAVDDNDEIIGRNAAVGLSEATVTGKRNWINKFKKDNPQVFAIINQMAHDNVQQRKQAGFYDADNKPTISKEEAERNKNNYFEVAALNTAMGSPYAMNQNSFNYNPFIANQQTNFGATYPISSINNAFNAALGDVALNYGFKKGVPVVLDKLGFFVRKPDSFTRGIGETVGGIRDLQRSGVVRGNPYGTEVSAKLFGKLFRKDRGGFRSIVDSTGDPSIAQKWYSRSLSKDEFYKLRNAEIKRNGEYNPSKSILDQGGFGDNDFVRQFNTYDDYLKYLEQTKRPTSLDDSGEALAYFYDDGRNPIAAGHDYAASNYGVRVNNASSYNPRIFNGHLHYSFPTAIPVTDPNVEIFRKVTFGPFNFTRKINKTDFLNGKIKF